MTEIAHAGTPILCLGFSLLVVVLLVLDFVLLKAKGQVHAITSRGPCRLPWQPSKGTKMVAISPPNSLGLCD